MLEIITRRQHVGGLWVNTRCVMVFRLFEIAYMYMKMKLSVFQEMIDEADRDGDGEINEAEFLRIMKKTSLYWRIILSVEVVKIMFLSVQNSIPPSKEHNYRHHYHHCHHPQNEVQFWHLWSWKNSLIVTLSVKKLSQSFCSSHSFSWGLCNNPTDCKSDNCWLTNLNLLCAVILGFLSFKFWKVQLNCKLPKQKCTMQSKLHIWVVQCLFPTISSSL